jgi:FdhD protein
MDAVRSQLSAPLKNDSIQVSSSVITALPNRLRDRQKTFAETGGLHAAGLFDVDGNPQLIMEDVGRHNALDKLIGSQLLDGHFCNKSILVVSGRASFELVQKAVAAQIPVMVAVGAPSSLAAELAQEFGITLIGFASATRFNVYSHPHRLSKI